MVSEPSNMANQTNTISSSLSINFVQPVKLDRYNYLVWKTQVRATIIANGLERFINGNSVCLERYLTELKGELRRSGVQSRSGAQSSQRQENPEYITRMKTDKLLQSWMLSSMVDNVLIMVIQCEASLELLELLAEIFMPQSKARYMPLKMQIISNQQRKAVFL